MYEASGATWHADAEAVAAAAAAGLDKRQVNLCSTQRGGGGEREAVAAATQRLSNNSWKIVYASARLVLNA